ncbi:large neutral amino acids transporter small subunit 1-like [Haliotis asinina]|uniref:large neutral amino acids transporter small subunit 1-like n=1 Tax=Haliotis asinina TaxID=109174 RepID=UPI003531A3B1
MTVGLKRQLGVISAISYVTGGIIGGGIFVSPSSVLAGAGASLGLSLCVWVFCGFISYCGALSYAELGTRIKRSGGSYTYVRAAFGDMAGFTVLWAQLFVVRPLAAVLGSLVTAEYIMRPIYLECPDMAPKSAKILLATVILSFIVACNCYSVRAAAGMQTVSTVCKVSALVVIIVAGLYHLSQGHNENFREPFVFSDLNPGGFTSAVYAGLYAYVGWDHINNAVEEIVQPQRTMPIAILGGLAIPTVCYITANIAYHAVMTNQEILSGLAVAVVFGERMLGPIKWAMVPCIAMSAAGITNVIIFTSSRLNFVGGRDNIFPRFLGMVNAERKTPMPTVLLVFAFSLVFLCLGDVKSIIGTYSFVRALPEAVAIVGILRLRRKFPDSHDVYKVPLVIPVIFVVFFFTLSLTAIAYQPVKFLVPLAFVLLAVPVYFISDSAWWHNGPSISFNATMVTICRRLLLCQLADVPDTDK